MENEIWHGSVLIVTRGGGSAESPQVPELRWRVKGNTQNGTSSTTKYSSNGTNGANANGAVDSDSDGVLNGVDYGVAQGSEELSGHIESAPIEGETKVTGTRLYSNSAHTFWRFNLAVPMQQSELRIEYNIPELAFPSTQTKRDVQYFYIPAITESMRIMFHSCNGFSVGTDEEAWSGAALWNDVLRVHEKTPFHVMYVDFEFLAFYVALTNQTFHYRLGGGDQIYNDGIRVKGPCTCTFSFQFAHSERRAFETVLQSSHKLAS
jgi:hypothetical protein